MTDDQNTSPPSDLPVSPSAIGSVAVGELDRVSAFVRAIPITEWSRPSAAASWTVGDVVTHLGLALSVYARVLSLGRSGRGTSGVVKAMGQAAARLRPNATGAINAVNRAVPRLVERALPPEVVQGQFSANARMLCERIEGLQSIDFTKGIFYSGHELPLSFFLGQLVNELAMHRWDIESVLDPSAHLSQEALSVIPWFFWSGTGHLLRPSTGPSGTVQVVLSDPPAQLWWRFQGRGATPGRGTVPDPDATVTASANAFCLTMAGRLSFDEALRSGSLRSEGQESLSRRLLESWTLV